MAALSRALTGAVLLCLLGCSAVFADTDTSIAKACKKGAKLSYSERPRGIRKTAHLARVPGRSPGRVCSRKPHSVPL
jgi:hypothetical protein